MAEEVQDIISGMPGTLLTAFVGGAVVVVLWLGIAYLVRSYLEAKRR